MWGSRHIERLWTALRARFDERGAVMVEYALIIGLIGIIAIPGLAFFGPALHDSFIDSARHSTRKTSGKSSTRMAASTAAGRP